MHQRSQSYNRYTEGRGCRRQKPESRHDQFSEQLLARSRSPLTTEGQVLSATALAGNEASERATAKETVMMMRVIGGLSFLYLVFLCRSAGSVMCPPDRDVTVSAR